MGENAMTDQGSTPPPPDPNQPGGYGATPPGGGYGAPPPPGGYGQPTTGGYGQPAGPPPPNYLVWAILTTVLCCLPLGVASIVFAAQVNSKWAAGDVAGARESSEKAKKFAIWSAISYVVIVVVVLILVIALGAGSDSTS
jgi:hypothetical protein